MSIVCVQEWKNKERKKEKKKERKTDRQRETERKKGSHVFGLRRELGKKDRKKKKERKDSMSFVC